MERLRRAGVEVVSGVLRAECDALNAHWFRYIKDRRPYVTLKAAVTLDGRIATRTGDARWVTGEEARRWVHGLRDRVDAILVGAGTARADDPLLDRGAALAGARVRGAGREDLPAHRRAGLAPGGRALLAERDQRALVGEPPAQHNRKE